MLSLYEVWGEAAMRHEQYKDLLREAERERLIQQVLAAYESHLSLATCTLAWLGQRLVAWGTRLQGHLVKI